ncbi:MAG: tyrosine-type recombinase/integrase [Fuerstiella sp.]
MTVKDAGGKQKPKKPYPEFPFYAHRNGQWARKVKGKTHFFGTWDDPDAAMQNYEVEIHDIHRGRIPRRRRAGGVATPDQLTVADMVNLYLASQEVKKNRGKISLRHFSDCLTTGTFIVKHFGRSVAASQLKATDFASFGNAFPESWGPTKIGMEIQRTRCVFKWAADSELIPSIPNFGPDFKKPTKSENRVIKAQRCAEQGSLDFKPDEIRTLWSRSTGWLRACILLGINTGFGNADCGGLHAHHIDSKSGWYDLARAKTGIPRRFYVWEETRNAIREAMKSRPVATHDSDDSLCLLTSHGRPVFWEYTRDAGTVSRCDNVGKEFTKLVKAAKIRRGRGFYSLRRTFETVGGNSQDQIAVNYVMGHGDESMAAVYRQGIDDQRLIDVAEHVRQWLWMRTCGRCKHAQFSVADDWKCEACGKDHAASE